LRRAAHIHCVGWLTDANSADSYREINARSHQPGGTTMTDFASNDATFRSTQGPQGAQGSLRPVDEDIEALGGI
jgi:hypothetical protein